MRNVLIALALGAVATGALAGPPETEVREVRDEIHGKTIVDPYRWLEGSAAPEIDPDEAAALDAEVSAWTDRQNEYTRGVLDNLPGRAKVEARLRDLMEVGTIGVPTPKRNRYFYSERKGDQNQSVVYVREGLDGEPRVLLDPNKFDEKEGLITVSWTTPSHDGELMAFGMYRAGDENSTLYVMEVDSGKWLAEEIPGKVGSVNWLPDSSGFIYRRLEDLDNPYSAQIKHHELGTHHSQDAVLFEQYKDGPLAATWGPFAFTDDDGHWLILGYYTSTASNDLWVADLDEFLRTGELEMIEIVKGEDASFSGNLVGDTLFMKTTLDAPNGKIIAVDLNKPVRSGWKTVLEERKDAVLEGVSSSRGYLVARYLRDAQNEIVVLDRNGRKVRDLTLPGIGTASVSASSDRNEAFLSFASFNEPNSIYHLDLETGKTKLWARPDVPVDPSIVAVDQVFFKSKDGTRVPMFIVHKKGLKKNGRNPTWMSGYGGFNVSRKPGFYSTLFPWIEDGGIYVVVNLRGGGEYGEEWHRAGMLENKQNVYDDFIGAAEYLIAKRYTSPAHLAISGGSNGGLLTGAALVQRPDLFSAVVSAVPLLDMLRYQNFLMARYWVPEYGSAEDPDQFEFLRAYSPYHNVKKGTDYPAVFLTAGENDSRVHALHARKMAALLQAATGSDPEEEPVLLWVDRSAGHGQGKPLDLRVRDAADREMFLRWQLGMLD